MRKLRKPSIPIPICAAEQRDKRMQSLKILYEEITKTVADRFGVSTDAIMSRSRQHSTAAARRVAMLLAFRITHDKCGDIAAYYNLTPASFSRSIAAVKADLSHNPDLSRWIEQTEGSLARKHARHHLRPLRETSSPIPTPPPI